MIGTLKDVIDIEKREDVDNGRDPIDMMIQVDDIGKEDMLEKAIDDSLAKVEVVDNDREVDKLVLDVDIVKSKSGLKRKLAT